MFVYVTLKVLGQAGNQEAWRGLTAGEVDRILVCPVQRRYFCYCSLGYVCSHRKSLNMLVTKLSQVPAPVSAQPLLLRCVYTVDCGVVSLESLCIHALVKLVFPTDLL